MPDDTQNNQPAAAPATEQPFSATQAVSDVFSNLNRSPLPDRPTAIPREPNIQETPPTSSSEEQGQVATPPYEPQPAPSLTPEDKTDWKKRYGDLQSDMDRRMNKAQEQMRTEFTSQMQALTAALMQRQAPPPPDENTGYGEHPALSPQQAAMVRAEAERLLEARLASDPRLQVAGQIGDWARYREEKKDSTKYDPFVRTLLKHFPAKAGEDVYEKLQSAYNFFADLEAEARAQANPQGEGVRRENTPPPQPVHPQNNGATAAELAARAARYRMETGIAATSATRPAIDTYGNEDEAISAIVDSALRGRR
jgi:hypothetical protein